MGRSPCCEKIGVKKGPWTPEEDITLVTYIQAHGPGNWRAIPTNTGLRRCSKSCRLRWTNYLRPGIKRGNFSDREEKLIIHLQALLGNRWAAIASYLPERTDNDIKNYWNTHLRKKLRKQQPDADGPVDGTAHNMAAKGQWERRLQTDIHMAKKALREALSLETTPSFMSNLNQPSSSSDGCNLVLTRGHGQSRSPQPVSPSTAGYASSAENISRLLQGWMGNGQMPMGGGPAAAGRSNSPSTQHYSSSCNTACGGSDSTSSDGAATTSFANDRIVTSSEALESLLSFERCSSALPGAASGAHLLQEESKPVPLSFLETWLFDDGQETPMDVSLHNTAVFF